MNLEKQLKKHESIIKKILSMLHVSPLFNHDHIEKLIIEMNEGEIEKSEEKPINEERYR